MRTLIALLALAPAVAEAAPDPWEGVNRRIHGFNALAQSYALAPAAAFWRAQVHAETRAGIGRVVANLGEPVTALSAVAAGDLSRAWSATARFGINATLAWGVPSGPYLVLPLLGPTTLRDAGAALAANAALAQGLGTAPVASWQAGDAFLAYERAEPALTRLEADSLDSYAALRSAWLQRRAAACPQDARAEDDDAEATPH